MIGKVVNGYTIVAAGAARGHGVTFQARAGSGEEPVRLLVVRPEIARSSGFARRFANVAGRVREIRHPLLVNVRDFASAGAVLYLAQDWIPGHGLDRYAQTVWKRGQSMPAMPVLQLVARTAKVLDQIHGQGLLHGNLTAASIWRPERPPADRSRRESVTMLADLGLPPLTLQDVRAYPQTLHKQLPFCAPEQLLDGEASVAADIYSLAATLYYLLTGQPPVKFEGQDASVSQALRQIPAPVHHLRQDLSEKLAAVIQKGISRDPSRRFRSAGQFAQMLNVVSRETERAVDSTSARGSAIPSGKDGPSSDEVKYEAVRGSVACNVDREHLRLEPGESESFQIDVENQGSDVDHFTVSIDGLRKNWISIPQEFVRILPGATAILSVTLRIPRRSASSAGEYDFYVLVSSTAHSEDIVRVERRLTVMPFTDLSAEMGPGALSHGQAVTVSLKNDGNTEATISIAGTDPADAVRFSGNEEDVQLGAGESATIPVRVMARERSLFGQGRTLPFELVAEGDEGLHLALEGQLQVNPPLPAWLVGVLGIFIVLALIALVAPSLLGDEREQAGPAVALATTATATPTGAALGGSATTQVGATRGEATGAREVTATSTLAPSASAPQAGETQVTAVATDGPSLTDDQDESSANNEAAGGGSAMTATPLAGAPAPTSPLAPTATASPAVTPVGGGGGLLAYQVGSDGEESAIRLVSPDGQDARHFVGVATQPAWSSDGRRLAFTRPLYEGNGEGRIRVGEALIVVTADGTELGSLVSGEQRIGGLAWSPDGRQIAFHMGSEDADGRFDYQVFVAASDGSGMNQLTTGEDGLSNAWPRWSPDGSLILYQSLETSSNEGQTGAGLYLMRSDGSGKRPVMSDPNSEVVEGGYDWSPDGTQIVYAVEDLSAGSTLYTNEIASTAAANLIARHDTLVTGPRWSPDGTRILYLRQSQSADEADLFTVAPDGSNSIQLTDGFPVADAVWSPDGTRILLATDGDGDGLRQLLLIDRNGNTPRVLTASEESVSSPSWQPSSP